jgi:hypothetical protein
MATPSRGHGTQSQKSPYVTALGRIVGLLLVVVITSATARAEHATIRLQVTASDGRQESSADQEPPPGGLKKRPRLAVKRGEQLVFEFLLTNAYPHKQIDGVTVRYFVVRAGSFGAKELPNLKSGAVSEGNVVMNFKPKCRVGARFNVRVDEPGIYLVRVDTLNTESDHEHFSAIDLDVK